MTLRNFVALLLYHMSLCLWYSRQWNERGTVRYIIEKGNDVFYFFTVQFVWLYSTDLLSFSILNLDVYTVIYEQAEAVCSGSFSLFLLRDAASRIRIIGFRNRIATRRRYFVEISGDNSRFSQKWCNLADEYYKIYQRWKIWVNSRVSRFSKLF